MTKKTVQQYLDRPVLVLPVKHSRLDLSLTEIEGFCAECGRPVAALRGIVREWHSCLEVELAGACHPCKTVTFARKFRWYSWGVLEQREGRGWVAYRHDQRNIFWNIFRNIFDRFCKAIINRVK